MEKSPISMRKHIAIIGETNAGKSTLFNKLLGQASAIVSEIKGTTTDPIVKTMELIPYGPVAIIDTAGMGDDTSLGTQRMEKTLKILDRADMILYVIDATDSNATAVYFDKPMLIVFNKCELLSEDELLFYKTEHPEAVFLFNYNDEGIADLKKKIIKTLEKQDRDDATILGDLLPEGSNVVLVTPIDGAAPKGRLILPQVQVLRDCLDYNMAVYVTKENTLKNMLDNINRVDLVVTDSQVFKFVDEIVPKNIPLTSFSMLLARKNGNFRQYLYGAEQMANLKNGSRVLVLEGCTHNTTHEDIGRVKIPMLIENKLGVKCEYDYAVGYDFPDDLSSYDLILSCGMCMINREENLSRLRKITEAGKPITNYGIAIAYLNGILARAKEIFK